MCHHDKKFLTAFLPLAVATFVSGPCAVLHTFGLLEPAVSQVASLPQQLFQSAVGVTSPLVWVNTHASRQIQRQDLLFFPQEVPLLFQMDAYPDSGFKTIHVNDTRFITLTEAAAASTESPAAVYYVGYIPILETQKLRNVTHDDNNLPQGDLIQVHHVSYNTSHVEMETEKKQRFRLKTVRKDQMTGLLYGRVEWI